MRVHVARMGSAVKFTFVRACVCMGVRGPPCACACVCGFCTLTLLAKKDKLEDPLPK